MAKTFAIDAPRVTRDEATELCVYHLRMAAALFEVVPDDNNKSLEAEIERQCKDDVDSAKLPAKVWAGSIYAIYDEMKVRD